MREAFRGYAAAKLARLGGPQLGSLERQLAELARALDSSDDLLRALSDDAFDVTLRLSIADDLLASADPVLRSLVGFAVKYDSPGEFGTGISWLRGRVGAEVEYREGGADPDPPAGRLAVDERIEGFALGVFEEVDSDPVIDEVEDQLFSMSRILESNTDLRLMLSDPTRPLSLRDGILVDLVGDKVDPTTLELLRYVVKENRGELVVHLDRLVERVVDERGRRIASVTSAIDLDDGQVDRLSESLSRRTGRRVTLRTSVDPSVLGGLRIVVADTILDGTVSSRLDLAREALAGQAGTAAGNDERSR